MNRIDVYDRIVEDGLLSPKSLACYKALFEMTVGTAREIAQKAGPSAGACPWKRVSDLKKQKAITKIGSKVCSVSGVKAALYACSSNLPEALNGNKQMKKELKRLERDLLQIAYVTGRLLNTDSKNSDTTQQLIDRGVLNSYTNTFCHLSARYQGLKGELQ